MKKIAPKSRWERGSPFLGLPGAPAEPESIAMRDKSAIGCVFVETRTLPDPNSSRMACEMAIRRLRVPDSSAGAYKTEFRVLFT